MFQKWQIFVLGLHLCVCLLVTNIHMHEHNVWPDNLSIPLINNTVIAICVMIRLLDRQPNLFRLYVWLFTVGLPPTSSTMYMYMGGIVIM